MKKPKKPSYNLEKQYLSSGIDYVFGIDEVGRGCFAGPLVASAVCFDKKIKRKWFKDINDSKQLTAKERRRLSKLIIRHGSSYTETIDVETINKIGIGKANTLIFKKLIKKISNDLGKNKIQFLIDGNKKDIQIENLEFIVKGDNKIISVAAASIVAKDHRDRIMRDLGKVYRGYNLSKNKGYGTKSHQEAIKKLGLSDIHRKSFDLQKFTQ